MEFKPPVSFAFQSYPCRTLSQVCTSLVLEISLSDISINHRDLSFRSGYHEYLDGDS